MAFDKKNIYYITTASEINIFHIASGENEPIPNIRADFFYVRGKNLLPGYGQRRDCITPKLRKNELVTKNHTGNFACDEEYIYYHNQVDQNYLYRTNLQTGLSELMAPITNGYAIQVIDGYPYLYDNTYGADLSSETYRVDKRTLTYEKIDYQWAE